MCRFFLAAFAVIIICDTANAQSWHFVGSEEFSAGGAGATTIAADPSGTPYVAYIDEANSNKASVMKYNGSNWVNVGVPGFSPGEVGWIALAIDPSGTPYVTFQDYAMSSTLPPATVMKYNGSSWVIVGTEGFSSGKVIYTAMAIDATGTPYVCYQDDAYSGGATVQKFDGSTWVTVGSHAFSAGEVTSTAIAIDNTGAPYVGYTDFDSSQKATVMKFNGTGWTTVGHMGFSAGAVGFIKLAINAGGTPYIGYTDYGTGQKATVMKFDGANWVDVGVPGFSAGQVSSTTLALDTGGTPYVFYTDLASTERGTVMKFSGGSWVNAGSAGFTDSSALSTSIAIDNAGTPYIVYSDGISYKATVMKFSTIPVAAISGDSTLCVGANASLSDVTAAGTWTSSDPGVVTVTPGTGILTGLIAGTATITYSVSGSTATMGVTVYPLPSAGSIMSGSSVVCADSAIVLTDGVSGGTWSSGNTAIATVSTAGSVSGVSAGGVIITYSITSAFGCVGVATMAVTVDACGRTGLANNVPGTSTMTVFPNPGNGLFTISVSSVANEDATVIVTNMLGEKVRQLTVLTNKETELQLNTPPGVYFLSVITKSRTLSAKVVIE